MRLVAQPLYAEGGRVRVWVGLFGADQAPVRLDWLLLGNPPERRPLGPPASVEEIRPLTPALPDELRGEESSRCFTGIYEIPSVPSLADGAVQIRVAGAPPAEAPLRPLPAATPRFRGPGGPSFRVLMTSCYDRRKAESAVIQNLARDLRKGGPIDLGLFLGDQIYLDIPTLKNFPEDPARLAEIFFRNYHATWTQADAGAPAGEAALFGLAPRVCIPDDHEYWNNYPFSSPFIQNSYSQTNRDHWATAARALYGSFQLGRRDPDAAPIVFDVPPLSFFIADSRTDRQGDHSRSSTAGTVDALEEWCRRIIAERRFGVFVTGQSVVGDHTSWWGRLTSPLAKRMGDYGLQDFHDFGRIRNALGHAARPDRPLLCLTGDVHFGRVIRGRQRGDPRPSFYEVISSPLALVEFIGVDQLKTVVSEVRGAVGRRDPWPRHGTPAKPPPEFQVDDPARTVRFDGWRKQRGEHVALLEFRTRGPDADPTVLLDISFLPIHPDAARHGLAAETLSIELGACDDGFGDRWEALR